MMMKRGEGGKEFYCFKDDDNDDDDKTKSTRFVIF
jgi:hypothetical protein